MSEPLLLALLVLTAYRVTRLWIDDDWPPVRWARERALARAGSWADGLVCYWCVGSWVAIGATAVTAQVVSLPLPVLWAGASAAGVGLISEVAGDG